MGIIEQVASIVKDRMSHDTTGHDFWHVQAVLNNAQAIASHEKNANMILVSLAALLHDIADHKLGYSDEETRHIIQSILSDFMLNDKMIEDVISIVQSVSYKGGNNIHAPASLEAMIVQDADRLEAMGAIGIARAFAYGGSHQRCMYDPTLNRSLTNNQDTIAHFYDKLLLLKDLMHTQTAKKEAQKRHDFMLLYLDNFYAEWQGRL